MKKYLLNIFKKEIVIKKWKFNLILSVTLFVGTAIGSYLTVANLLIPRIFAATSPWTQTDWSGGQGSSTTNQYSSSSNIDVTSTAGEFSLEENSNLLTGYDMEDSDSLDNWLGVLPSSVSGLQMWFDASSSVYKDSGSTLASDGETVQQWNDMSGNSKNATQSASGSRPTYRADSLNGRPALDFDGNDSMAAPNVINGNGARTRYSFFTRFFCRYLWRWVIGCF